MHADGLAASIASISSCGLNPNSATKALECLLFRSSSDQSGWTQAVRTVSFGSTLLNVSSGELPNCLSLGFLGFSAILTTSPLAGVLASSVKRPYPVSSRPHSA